MGLIHFNLWLSSVCEHFFAERSHETFESLFLSSENHVSPFKLDKGLSIPEHAERLYASKSHIKHTKPIELSKKLHCQRVEDRPYKLTFWRYVIFTGQQ